MTTPAHMTAQVEPSAGDALVRAAGAFLLTLVLLVGSWVRNQEYRDGRMLWEDVVAKSPEKVRGYNNLGTVYQGMKLYDRALATFQRAMELDPYTSLHAFGNIGNVYIDMQDYERAAEIFTRILMIDTRDYQSYAGRGKAWFWLGRYEAAVGEFSRALEIKPSVSRYYLYRAEAYLKLGDVDRAREDMEASCRLGWQESCDRLDEMDDE